jgi:extradiol dioxygenase family protein
MKAAFHLAFPVKSIGITKMFYHEVLGCPVGRSTEEWIDFDFFGHQISAHISVQMEEDVETSEVDGKKVPLRHFGAILPFEKWNELAHRLKAAGAEFVIEPQIRYEGQVGEQHIMFVNDPSGNALEFKAFTNSKEVFQD